METNGVEPWRQMQRVPLKHLRLSAKLHGTTFHKSHRSSAWELQHFGLSPILMAVLHNAVESSWNVMAHGDAREGKWRGNWWMEWVVSTLHTTSEHGVSSITTADAHTSAASSRLNWRPCRFKWARPFRRKTKSCFCACAIIFQTQSTYNATKSRSPTLAMTFPRS